MIGRGAAKTCAFTQLRQGHPAAADGRGARPCLARPTSRADVATRTESGRSIETPVSTQNTF